MKQLKKKRRKNVPQPILAIITPKHQKSPMSGAKVTISIQNENGIPMEDVKAFFKLAINSRNRT
jgi:hypothetical protein